MFNRQALPVDPERNPVLFCVVDTEEEFDWNAPLARENTSVQAARQITRLQKLLSRYGVRPTYVVDYPIASQAEGREPFKDIFDSGDCAIGAHLHPWVTPPYEEEISGRASFACNLDPALEREKMRVLRDEVADRFGKPPVVYKAGRYGLGPASVESLDALGFMVDTSVNPRMDFSGEEGPSFREQDARPFVFRNTRELVEIPCTTGYTGVQSSAVQRLRDRFDQPDLRWTHLPGILARVGVSNRVMLSPEGYLLSELVALTRTLMSQGVRTFSLTLHSPSVEPGCTPYVRTQDDLRQLLDTIEGYLDFFFGDLMGTTTTVEAFAREQLQAGGPMAVDVA